MSGTSGFFLACSLIAAMIARYDWSHTVYRQEAKAYAALSILSFCAALWYW